MKRLDIYKNQLEKAFEETKDERKRISVYQELINRLNTYTEKKEFADHYEKLRELVLN